MFKASLRLTIVVFLEIQGNPLQIQTNLTHVFLYCKLYNLIIHMRAELLLACPSYPPTLPFSPRSKHAPGQRTRCEINVAPGRIKLTPDDKRKREGGRGEGWRTKGKNGGAVPTIRHGRFVGVVQADRVGVVALYRR